MKNYNIAYGVFVIVFFFFSVVQADTLVDFEAPTYTVDAAINGQDGWTADGAMVKANSDIGGGTWVLDFSGNVGARITASRDLDTNFDVGLVTMSAKVKWTYDKIGAFSFYDANGTMFLSFGGSKAYLDPGLYWFVDGGPAGPIVDTNMPSTSTGTRFVEVFIEIDLDTNLVDISWSEIGGAKTVLFSDYEINTPDFNSFSFANSKAASMVDDIDISGIGCQEIIMKGGLLIGDINHDCYVDFLDLLGLFSSWLACNDPQNPECDLFLQQNPEYRLFVTKVYPGHGILSSEDFSQLADAGFTTVVNRWIEDVPGYAQGAAAFGLNSMTWQKGNIDAEPLSEIHTVTYIGNETRYTVPYSSGAWAAITQIVCDRAVLSNTCPNFKGVIFDFEIYDPNKAGGFSESYDANSFVNFLTSKGLSIPSPLTEPSLRRTYLSNRGLLDDFIAYQYDLVAQQVILLRQAVDNINPGFQFGVYGWGCLLEAVKENLASESAPLLDLSSNTYGRTPYPYQADYPDRPGLRWSLTKNAQLENDALSKGYPVVFLGGHYPHSPGPLDGTSSEQYKFTVRQSFNSAVYGSGYWIWTEWTAPAGLDKQEWIDDMMNYFKQAKDAQEAQNYTWASSETDSIVDPEATVPKIIYTSNNADFIKAWNPLTGFEIEPSQVPVSWSTTVVGDVDSVAGDECVNLENGWIKILDGASETLLLKFFVGIDQTKLQLVEGE